MKTAYWEERLRADTHIPHYIHAGVQKELLLIQSGAIAQDPPIDQKIQRRRRCLDGHTRSERLQIACALLAAALMFVCMLLAPVVFARHGSPLTALACLSALAGTLAIAATLGMFAREARGWTR